MSGIVGMQIEWPRPGREDVVVQAEVLAAQYVARWAENDGCPYEDGEWVFLVKYRDGAIASINVGYRSQIPAVFAAGHLAGVKS